jgi:hypothetical protein
MRATALRRGAWTRPASLVAHPDYQPALPKPERKVKGPSRPEAKSELKRCKPIRWNNRERRAQKYVRNFEGGCGHDSFVRSLGCAVPECARWDIEAAHEEKRKMGGAGGTWRDLVDLCTSHHREQERSPSEFEAKYGLCLKALRHALVVANPRAVVGEQLVAWARLQAFPPHVVAHVLQRVFDLTGHHVAPPSIPSEPEAAAVACP